MIQRCKKCGNWIKGESIDEFIDSENNEFEGIFKVFKLGKVGKQIDNIFNLPIKVVGKLALGKRYYFYCSKCNKEWFDKIENEDKEKELVNEKIKSLLELFDASNREKENFILDLQKTLSKILYRDQLAQMYQVLAFSQFKLLGNVNEALNAISESLKLFDDPNTHALRGIILGEGRTPNDKYKTLQELIYCKEPDKRDSFFFTQQEYLMKLEEQNLHYAEHFLEIPQNQRKFLVIDNELHYLPDSFKVLTINSIPTELQFPVGHPIDKQMYICHPLKPKMYLPVEDYQLELFRDEVKELCVLLQALGAKKLSITDNRSNEKSLDQKRRLDIEAGGGFKTTEANVKGSMSSESEEYLKIKNEFVRNQEFERSSIPPCVPEGLVWYSHRADWQQMALQRNQGTLIHHHDYLSIQKNTLVNENEKRQLEADFKTLMAKGNGKVDMDKSRLFKENSDYAFELNVDFYPLSAYKNNNFITESLKSGKSKSFYWLIAFVLFLGLIFCLLFYV